VTCVDREERGAGRRQRGRHRRPSRVPRHRPAARVLRRLAPQAPAGQRDALKSLPRRAYRNRSDGSVPRVVGQDVEEIESIEPPARSPHGRSPATSPRRVARGTGRAPLWRSSSVSGRRALATLRRFTSLPLNSLSRREQKPVQRARSTFGGRRLSLRRDQMPATYCQRRREGSCPRQLATSTRRRATTARARWRKVRRRRRWGVSNFCYRAVVCR